MQHASWPAAAACVRRHPTAPCEELKEHSQDLQSQHTLCSDARWHTHEGVRMLFCMAVLPLNAESHCPPCCSIVRLHAADRSTHAIAIGKLGYTKSTATTCSNHRTKPCSTNLAGKYQRSRAYQFLLATQSKQATKSLTIWYGILLPTKIFLSPLLSVIRDVL